MEPVIVRLEQSVSAEELLRAVQTTNAAIVPATRFPFPLDLKLASPTLDPKQLLKISDSLEKLAEIPGFEGTKAFAVIIDVVHFTDFLKRGLIPHFDSK
jgi:hypothetical protein